MKSAVCLIVRDEARDIQEWIAHHALAGFDSLIIYDNGSRDGTVALVEAARARFDIRLHAWPDRSRRSQLAAYEDACAAYAAEFDWIAFLDSDEFFVPRFEQPVNQFLAQFEPWSAVAVNWAIYGANGHMDYPPGLVTEAFTRRAAEDFAPAYHVKSIIRPSLAVRCVNPHYFEMREARDGHYCDSLGRYMLWQERPDLPEGVARGLSRAAPKYSVARINHYFTRSRAHWQDKLRRGYPPGVETRKMADFDLYNRNEVDDPIALRGIASLRAAVTELRENGAG